MATKRENLGNAAGEKPEYVTKKEKPLLKVVFVKNYQNFAIGENGMNFMAEQVTELSFEEFMLISADNPFVMERI